MYEAYSMSYYIAVARDFFILLAQLVASLYHVFFLLQP